MEAPQGASSEIWRYVDLPRFLSLLTGTLWFARADTFEDKWEGFSRAISRGKGTDGAQQENLALRAYEKVISQHKDWRRQLNKCVYVNCWTLAAESIPMWKIYGSYDTGIAIQSSVERFRKSVQLEGFAEHKTSHVEYFDTLPLPDFDYSKGIEFSWPKACELHLRKRSCFKFEQEWRAVIVGWGSDRNSYKNKGIQVPVVVDDLIERVFVSPLASDSFLRTVTTASEKFGLKVMPRRSELARRRPRQAVPGDSSQPEHPCPL